MVHCVENMIKAHKNYVELSESLKYPVAYSFGGYSVGERFTAGFVIVLIYCYSKFRILITINTVFFFTQKKEQPQSLILENQIKRKGILFSYNLL